MAYAGAQGPVLEEEDMCMFVRAQGHVLCAGVFAQRTMPARGTRCGPTFCGSATSHLLCFPRVLYSRACANERERAGSEPHAS